MPGSLPDARRVEEPVARLRIGIQRGFTFDDVRGDVIAAGVGRGDELVTTAMREFRGAAEPAAVRIGAGIDAAGIQREGLEDVFFAVADPALVVFADEPEVV